MKLWTPADIATALWLDASDSSTLFDAVSGGSLVAADGAVARWEDKSGNANHATQSTSGSRPTRKTSIQNSLDVLRFNGSSHFFAGANTPCASDAKTVVAIVKNSNAVGGSIFQNRLGAGGVNIRSLIFRLLRLSSTTFIAGDTQAVNTTILTDLSTAWQSFSLSTWTQTLSSRAMTYWHNGTNYATSGIPNTEQASAGYHIGVLRSNATFLQYFPGDFCEIVVLDYEAEPTTVSKIEGSLAHKWGTAPNLINSHPYKNHPPVAVVPNKRRRMGLGGVL